MKLRYNFHFHTTHSCDGASLKMTDVVKQLTELGMEEFGVTDHLHTRYNISDIISARHDYLGTKPPKNFHFGIEVSCVSGRECDMIQAGDYVPWGDDPIYGLRNLDDFGSEIRIDIDEEDVKELGLDFVVGGIHWPLTTSEDRMSIIRNYRDQMLYLVNHPLVDVLAHPWDSLEAAAGLWYKYRTSEHIDNTVFHDIPREFNQEIANALLKQHKLAELNLAVLDTNRTEVQRYYLELFAEWRELGVKFSTGDDSHAEHFSAERFARIEKLLNDYGFTDEDIVSPMDWKCGK